MTKEISEEIDALLKFYAERKLISKKDIHEFSRVWKITPEFLKRLQPLPSRNDSTTDD